MKQVFVALMALIPLAAGAQLSGASFPIDTGTGQQTDPHTSCNGAAYTSDLSGSSGIRWYSYQSETITNIPTDGNQDLLSDVSGDTVVFTRFFPDGHSAIFSYDVTTGLSSELAPSPVSARQNASIGGGTVAWEDYGLVSGSLPAPEIVAFALPGGPAVRLTNDTLPDVEPAVSPDGTVIVFAKCSSSGTGCDIYQSVAFGAPTPVTSDGAAGDDRRPDTNGEIVVYQSNLDGDLDIYFAPILAGGPAAGHLDLPGIQRNPNVSGTLIAFESQDPSTGNFDIFVYDYATSQLYQVTATPSINEQLNDISVCGTTVRLVWSQRGPAGDFDIWGFDGELVVDEPTCQQDLTAACADPGARPLLAELTVVRTTGKPNVAKRTFGSASDEGLLCIDNAGATAGWVELNKKLEIGPSAFQQSVESVAKSVELKTFNKLTLTIAGAPGTSYSARVYGQDPACATPPSGGGHDDDDDGHDDDDDGHDDDDDGCGKKGKHTKGKGKGHKPSEDGVDLTERWVSTEAQSAPVLSTLSLVTFPDGTRRLADDGTAPQFALPAGCSSSSGGATVAGLLVMLSLLLFRRRTAAVVRRR